MGSPGEANGSLSMTTQLSASPTTSTPCQKLDVASSTAFGRASELLEQHAARGGSLHEQRIGERPLQPGAHRAQRGVAGEQDEGAAFGPVEDLDDFVGDPGGELRLSRVGHPPRQIEDATAARDRTRTASAIASRRPRRAGWPTYSNDSPTRRVADVSTVVRRRSNSRSRTSARDVDRQTRAGRCPAARSRRSRRTRGRRRACRNRTSSRNWPAPAPATGRHREHPAPARSTASSASSAPMRVRPASPAASSDRR